MTHSLCWSSQYQLHIACRGLCSNSFAFSVYIIFLHSCPREKRKQKELVLVSAFALLLLLLSDIQQQIPYHVPKAISTAMGPVI